MQVDYTHTVWKWEFFADLTRLFIPSHRAYTPVQLIMQHNGYGHAEE
jgi:hypothetical protein